MTWTVARIASPRTRGVADLVRAGEVLLRQRADAAAVPVRLFHLRIAHSSITLSISVSSSSAKIGSPCTFEKGRASTRKRARISIAS